MSLLYLTTNNQKLKTILCLLLVSSLFLGFSWPWGKKEKEEVIEIGAILPLTGDIAIWGNNTKEGIELAVERLNKNGGVNKKKIKVIYEDNQGSISLAVTSLKKLIHIDKVPAVIDDSMSSITLAMAPIAEKSKTVLLSTGATAPQISMAGEYIFRIWNSDAVEGKFIANFACENLGLKRVAIFYINNDYGKGLKEVFAKHFSAKGGNISISERFEQGATDFKTQLLKIKEMKPDALYLVGYPKEIPLVLKQLKEMGISIRVLSSVAFEDPHVITIAKDAAEGVIYPYPAPPTKEAWAVQEFLSSYHKKYGKDPGITCDVGYDAINLIAEALKLSNGYSGKDIKKGLMKIVNLQGASGLITFDENGDVNKPMGFKIVKNGEFMWYGP